MSGPQLHQPADPAVIVPGNHDGVHLGHQALLRGALEIAQRDGLQVVALTFSPHPAALLAPERAPTPLTTIDRRVELLRRAGADRVVVQRFDRAFASLSPAEFADRLQQLGARALVVGPDFRFGRDRAGDVALLQRFADARGLGFKVEPPVLLDGRRVSSSRVRQAVAIGEVREATRLLGHLHELCGVVVEGDRRGRSLGFPTANLKGDAVLQPADGVYAVVARDTAHSSQLLWGVANIGLRPTFEAGRSVEVHMLDFTGDLYGRTLRVGFVARLRGELRFSGVDALRAQIALDCEAARSALSDSDRGTWAWI